MYRIRKLFLFDSPRSVDWIIYFSAFIILQVPAIVNFYYNDGHDNAYLHFAQSVLDGHLYLPAGLSSSDLSLFNGRLYLPYPPLPGLLLVPFVWLFGSHVNTVAIATIMSCISLYLTYNICVRLKVEKEFVPWVILAVFFGTGYWFALFTTHHVYAFAHITAFLFQLLIINEILGRRRWWIVGLLIGCSFFTRQFTIFYLLFAWGYMYYLKKAGLARVGLYHLIALMLPIGLFICLYFGYNFVRFGNPLDSGYSHVAFIGLLNERVQHYGVFSWRYVLYNFYCTLIKGFNIKFEGPGHLRIADMDLWGTSLLSASPFLIASVKARWPSLLKVAAWATILTILVGQLFYHNNGFEQVNTSRFTLDFLPLLIVLTALGIKSIPGWLIRGMIGYAVALNVLSFMIHLIYQ